jgi:preprotein translocase subunit SecG
MLLGSIAGTLLGFLMGFLSLFLILLILVQRGRGGGLTGALGGPGGQSAFGSKAGDTFTLITVIIASVWGFSCAFTMWLLGTHTPSVSLTRAAASAGPGDNAAEAPNRLTLPPIGGQGSGAADLSGLDAGLSDGNATKSATETKPANEVELVPANTATEPALNQPAAETPSAPAATEAPAAAETPATPAPAATETPAAPSAPEAPAAEAPAAEAPAAEPASSEKAE